MIIFTLDNVIHIDKEGNIEYINHDTFTDLDTLQSKEKKPSFYELVETFLDAIGLMKKNLTKEIKQLREDIEVAHAKNYFVLEEEYERRLNICKNQLKYLDPKEVFGGITALQIARAKEREIKDFIKVNRAHKSICLFHSDREPSMHVYKNTYHCFACGMHGSVIDIIMKLRGSSFVEAVRYLTNCG